MLRLTAFFFFFFFFFFFYCICIVHVHDTLAKRGQSDVEFLKTTIYSMAMLETGPDYIN